MTKRIGQEEYVSIYGYDAFVAFNKTIFNVVRKTKEFNNKKKDVYNLMVFDHKVNGKDGSVTVECTTHKIFNGGKMVAYDFGIVSMIISDESIPDESLDRYNEVLKQFKDSKKPFSTSLPKSV